MSNYGVTDKGFVLKRMDTILEEVHAELSEGFGFDTRLSKSSFLNVICTTFCGQIADLWETAQDEYYAKYPATATGINLDNAVQYGGIRRKASSRSLYPLHCTGVDGTEVREEAIVATNTNPEVRLHSASAFTITRNSCNSVRIKVVSARVGEEYIISINGNSCKYTSVSGDVEEIFDGLMSELDNEQYMATWDNETLTIEDKDSSRNNVVSLTENLTTVDVTTIANFYTEDYGKITIPKGIVTKMVNNIAGFEAVTNILEPVYGRLRETDVELRQSYLSRSALRSNTMIDSIVSELLNNVSGVETVCGYENDTDEVNDKGMAPHSIEIIVEGGDNNSIADAILRKKAGGIQTNGNITVDVVGSYGDIIPVKFNRPEYLYAWIKVVLHGDFSNMPANYVSLTKESIIEDTSMMVAGTSLLTQLLNEGIYGSVSGINYIDIYTAFSTNKDYVPEDDEYVRANITATARQKVLVEASRIEVSLYDG